jgi:acyl-CoA reductase-like NAD-dependent aldehyde dehydrogenase
MRTHFFNASPEDKRERALRAAQEVAVAFPDKDAQRPGEAGVAVADDRPATPVAVSPADTSIAGEAVRDLLETLSADDVRRLLAAVESERAAEQERQAQERARLLETDRARAERERKAAARAKLESELAALTSDIEAALAQWLDERDALLSLAGQINGLLVQHNRTYTALQAARPDGVEYIPWTRPHRWHERAHTINVRALEDARADG